VKILVLGSGAREHSLIMALAAEHTHTLYAAPGNAGTAELAENVALDPTNKSVVVEIARDLDVDLVVVGPEAPLVAGVADALVAEGIAVFGPSHKAAAIEGSKSFAKDVMSAAGVPTGDSETVSTEEELLAALDRMGAPFVVKADGLAAGKGVLVTQDRQAAIDHAGYYLQDGTVVVEEFLDGPEVSLFFLSDGHTVMPLAPAQDYKRAFDGDQGPNTGGMGAYSPLPWLAEDFIQQVTDTIARPTINELASRGLPFVGLLYCGLIVTDKGVRVIEFNARFGDPETQVVLARLTSALAPLLLAAANGTLAESDPPAFSDDVALTVVLASEGYPEKPHTGRLISGLEDALAIDGVTVAHAATAHTDEGLIATGGRVLSVIATGGDFDAARARAYEALEAITLEGGHYRLDIAQRVSDDHAG
jgi:phosphoribosylamine--glycine ligase